MDTSFIDPDGRIDFRRLYDTYYAPFCIFAKRYVDDLSAREDIVEEVFVSLWRRFDGVAVEAEALLSYIRTSVRNGCLNHLAHRRLVDGYAEQTLGRTPLYAESPDSVYTLDEMYSLLATVVAGMSDDERMVFEQTIVGNKNQAEVAEALGVSVKTVGRCRRRILDRLRLHMKDYLPLLALCLSAWHVEE